MSSVTDKAAHFQATATQLYLLRSERVSTTQEAKALEQAIDAFLAHFTPPKGEESAQSAGQQAPATGRTGKLLRAGDLVKQMMAPTQDNNTVWDVAGKLQKVARSLEHIGPTVEFALGQANFARSYPKLAPNLREPLEKLLAADASCSGAQLMVAAAEVLERWPPLQGKADGPLLDRAALTEDFRSAATERDKLATSVGLTLKTRAPPIDGKWSGRVADVLKALGLGEDAVKAIQAARSVHSSSPTSTPHPLPAAPPKRV